MHKKCPYGCACWRDRLEVVVAGGVGLQKKCSYGWADWRDQLEMAVVLGLACSGAWVQSKCGVWDFGLTHMWLRTCVSCVLQVAKK